ncbi:hypothetical protein P9G84_05290 [Brevibacillus centrosporus]|uniref:hypothetical protein n=1 Tax=Brevibacillus centrosporus TaxID=54910 RepID=UPI000F09A6CE|nr:hypothetical protein [Brevibacillus centrosporus]MEC2128406.1 hypothetical protein [Brevibacillus centrosporus]RNB73751.1 hypothetical protein EDM55_01855 [Brevibacillus centrosporus]GED28981.1 hypothetical protein BCE02nite_01220 [Brevibacillus centrosporus]
MFSPSQLIQSLVQRAPASTPKPVELTPGQVFKGTVIKQYPDNMALVQIGGMQVQAKLETKLEQGQKAWLQVQPSSDVVTLKVLDTQPAGGGKEASLEGLIKSLGLPETKESRAIVTALMNANLPVSKETVQAFTAVAARLGTSDATVEAFMMAVKRNLPLTPDTVSGLKAFLSEKPVSVGIQNFLLQATKFLEDATAASAANGGNTPKTEGHTTLADTGLRQVVAMLKEKVGALPLALSNQAEIEPQNAIPASSTTAQGRTQTDAQIAQSSVKASITAAGSEVLVQSTDRKSGEAGGIQLAREQGNHPKEAATPPPVRLAQAQGESQPGQNLLPPKASGQALAAGVAVSSVENPQLDSTQQPKGTGSGPVQPAAPQTTEESLVAVNPRTPGEAASAIRGHADTPVQQLTGKNTDAAGKNPIQELFRQMGMTHERELMGQMLSGAASDGALHKQLESVKSLLLQITQSPNHIVPAGLRDAADQLLQQVTGQQLMMLQPTNQALSQIVLQIPIRSAQGEDTAYVQIESKKKDGGQLDADNCRLFFHLDLKEMGTTMIDVGIVNRIINLQIFNNAPWVDELVQGMKEGFAQQLQEVGFQLSAVRVQDIPKQKNSTSMTTGAKGAILSDYKGVDLRI